MKNNNLPHVLYKVVFLADRYRFLASVARHLNILFSAQNKIEPKKVHISCFFQPSFVFYFSTWPLSLVQTKLKIHNLFFVCSSMFSSRIQVFKYLDIAIQPIIHSPLVKHYQNLLIYTVDSATKLLTNGTTELVSSILGEFQDSS